MLDAVSIAAGGAAGALARSYVSAAAAQHLGAEFPFGTLIVNIAGSFLMGVLVEGMGTLWTLSDEVRLFFAVGFLGSFTTFSTFSLDVTTLAERGAWWAGALYLALSVAASVLALVAGLLLVRWVILTFMP